MIAFGDKTRSSDREFVVLHELMGILHPLVASMPPTRWQDMPLKAVERPASRTSPSGIPSDSRACHQQSLSQSIRFFFFGFHFRACWGTEPYVALHYVIARVFPVGPCQ